MCVPVIIAETGISGCCLIYYLSHLSIAKLFLNSPYLIQRIYCVNLGLSLPMGEMLYIRYVHVTCIVTSRFRDICFLFWKWLFLVCAFSL